MTTNFPLILIALLSSVTSLNWTYNPGCEDVTLCGEANMLHVQTRYHQYLWSTQNGLSTVIFSGNGQLSVNWTVYNEGGNSAVTVDTTSSLGLTFKSLYLENSTHHNQTIDLTAPSIRWRPLSIGNSTSTGPELQFSYTSSFMTVTVNVTESNRTRRMDEIPKMKITENNTLVDISVNLAGVPGLWVSQPTLAQIELEVAPAGINDTKQETSKSFDDEVAPALFRYDILRSHEGNWTKTGVYAMWRPVVYADSEKGKRTLISSLSSENINSSDHLDPSPSLLSKYYKKSDISLLRLTISPPEGKDCVPETFFWSLALGVGKPQSESLTIFGSILTLIIIGLPSAALILGVALIVIRRRQAHPGQGYRAI